MLQFLFGIRRIMLYRICICRYQIVYYTHTFEYIGCRWGNCPGGNVLHSVVKSKDQLTTVHCTAESTAIGLFRRYESLALSNTTAWGALPPFRRQHGAFWRPTAISGIEPCTHRNAFGNAFGRTATERCISIEPSLTDRTPAARPAGRSLARSALEQTAAGY